MNQNSNFISKVTMNQRILHSGTGLYYVVSNTHSIDLGFAL